MKAQNGVCMELEMKTRHERVQLLRNYFRTHHTGL